MTFDQSETVFQELVEVWLACGKREQTSCSCCSHRAFLNSLSTVWTGIGTSQVVLLSDCPFTVISEQPVNCLTVPLKLLNNFL